MHLEDLHSGDDRHRFIFYGVHSNKHSPLGFIKLSCYNFVALVTFMDYVLFIIDSCDSGKPTTPPPDSSATYLYTGSGAIYLDVIASHTDPSPKPVSTGK